MNIFMSGPVRPNEDIVLEKINKIKKQIPSCVFYLSVWEKEIESSLKDNTDYFFSNIEQSDEVIKELLNSTEIKGDKFIQTRMLNNFPNYNTYRMFMGIKYIFDFTEKNNLLKNDDIVIRVRTDLDLIFKNNIIDILKDIEISNSYMTNYWNCSSVGISDWFGISTYSNMKNIWYYKQLDVIGSDDLFKYNNSVYNSWNPETMIKNSIIHNSLNIIYLNDNLEHIGLDNRRK